MRGVVYECPTGVFTRLMEGSDSFEMYQEYKKTGKPEDKKKLDVHMKSLHNTFLKYMKP